MAALKTAGIFLSLLIAAGLPFLVIAVTKWKGFISIKHLLLGAAVYLFGRVILLPVIYKILEKTGLDVNNLYLGVLIMVLLCLSGKVILSRLLNNHSAKFLTSIGVGEATAEVYLFILPTVINYFCCYTYIQNGSIYQYLSQQYSNSEIAGIIDTFNAQPAEYYYYMITIISMLVIFQPMISMLADHKKTKSSHLAAVIFAVLLYAVYLVLPHFSYSAAVSIGFTVLAVCIVTFRRIIRKEEDDYESIDRVF